MPPMLRFDRSEIKKIRDLFDELDRTLVDATDLFTDIQQKILIPSAAKTFEAEGRPTKWKPLNAAYARHKRAKLGHTKILVWSGDLRNSVATEAGNEFSIRDVGPYHMKLGTTRPYAEVHQKSRPFLVVLDDDYEAIIDRAIDWFVQTGDYET